MDIPGTSQQIIPPGSPSDPNRIPLQPMTSLPPAYTGTAFPPQPNDVIVQVSDNVIPLPPKHDDNITEDTPTAPTFLKGMLPYGYTPDDKSESSSLHLSQIDDGNLTGNNFMGFVQGTIVEGVKRNSSIAKKILFSIFLAGWTIYLGFSIAYSVDAAMALIVFTGLGVFFWTWNFIGNHWGDQIYQNYILPMESWVGSNWVWLKW